MATIGDMLRAKGKPSLRNFAQTPSRHLSKTNKVFTMALDMRRRRAERDEEERIRREDPIVAAVMDSVFDELAAEDIRELLSNNLMDVLLLDEQAE